MAWILAILLFPWVGWALNKISNMLEAKREEEMRLIKAKEAASKEWYPHVKRIFDERGVEAPPYARLALFRKGAKVFIEFKHYEMDIMFNKQYITFIPYESEFRKDPSVKDKILLFPLDNILLYRKNKPISDIDEVIYKGKNITSSVVKASNSIANESDIINVTKYAIPHNERTYLYYVDEETDNIKALLFLSDADYRHLKKTIPDKEFCEVQQPINLNQNEISQLIVDRNIESLELALQRLKEWYDKGLIDEPEYKSKKDIILGQLSKNA